MSRSRGEPPESIVNAQYPYQVAILACELSWRMAAIMDHAQSLGCYRLNRFFSVDGEGFVTYRFATQEAAECFLKAFDGEWITSAERNKGTWRSKNVRMLVGCYVSETLP